jgi:hypothetical protein
MCNLYNSTPKDKLLSWAKAVLREDSRDGLDWDA